MLLWEQGAGLLLRSHYKSRLGSQCCMLKLTRFNMQGSEQRPSLAAGCQRAARCCDSTKHKGGSRFPEGILVSAEAVGMCSALPGSVAESRAHQVPLPTQAGDGRKRKLKQLPLPGIQNSSRAKDADKLLEVPSTSSPLLSHVWLRAGQIPADWDKQLLVCSTPGS